jgi:hypothetical protein
LYSTATEPHGTENAERHEVLYPGIPPHPIIGQLGSGAVFPVAEEDIACKPFPIPEHWPQIDGFVSRIYLPTRAALPGPYLASNAGANCGFFLR